jgi:putative transposase
MKLNRVGHLWQARFYSSPIESDSLGSVLAYAELNPVRAGLADRANDWKWYSAQAHLSGLDPTGLLSMNKWRELFSPDTWQEVLRQMHDDEDLLRRIRKVTLTGRPIARTEIIQQLERLYRRPLFPKKRGPKVKQGQSPKSPNTKNCIKRFW